MIRTECVLVAVPAPVENNVGLFDTQTTVISYHWECAPDVAARESPQTPLYARLNVAGFFARLSLIRFF